MQSVHLECESASVVSCTKKEAGAEEEKAPSEMKLVKMEREDEPAEGDSLVTSRHDESNKEEKRKKTAAAAAEEDKEQQQQQHRGESSNQSAMFTVTVKQDRINCATHCTSTIDGDEKDASEARMSKDEEGEEEAEKRSEQVDVSRFTQEEEKDDQVMASGEVKSSSKVYTSEYKVVSSSSSFVSNYQVSDDFTGGIGREQESNKVNQECERNNNKNRMKEEKKKKSKEQVHLLEQGDTMDDTSHMMVSTSSRSARWKSTSATVKANISSYSWSPLSMSMVPNGSSKRLVIIIARSIPSDSFVSIVCQGNLNDIFVSLFFSSPCTFVCSSFLTVFLKQVSAMQFFFSPLIFVLFSHFTHTHTQ